MDANVVSTEIARTRERLAEIDELRQRLPEDAFDERATLLTEEHQLEARLGELRAMAEKAGAGMAERKASEQSDLTHSPSLPQ